MARRPSANSCLTLCSLFLSFLFSSLLYSGVVSVGAKDNYVFISFNEDMDTTADDFWKIHIFPPVSGFWQWRSLRELVFIADSSLSDTIIYILSLTSELKEKNGSAIEDTDLIFTASKSVSYIGYQIPFEWEDIKEWDEEIDLRGSRWVYKIKPKIHPSYKQIIDILLCWFRVYHGSFKRNFKDYYYPHFISSEGKKYKVAVDSNGFLYLIDSSYGMRYRWWIFPENQCYRALDVSDNGEVLAALLSSDEDKVVIVHLISPEGEIMWSSKFYLKNSTDVGLSFISRLDKFLICINGEIFCYKILREQD